MAVASGALLVGGVAGAPSPSAGAPAAVARAELTAMARLASERHDWHLAPSLARLRAEIDARWPGRSRVSDGAIGDQRHRRTRNSHNPVGTKRGPKHGTHGAVHALDITAAGIDVGVVLNAVVGDRRVWYVIFDGRIWSRTYGWAPRGHVGDPHRTHLHVSLRDSGEAVAEAAESDTSRWLAPRAAPRSSRADRLSLRATRALQKALIRRGYHIPSGPTGWYGPETTKAVRAFQRDQGWTGSGADGIAGAMTLRRLGVEAPAGTSSREGTAAAKKAAAKKAAAKKAAAKKAAAKKAAAKKAAAKKAAAKKAAAKRAAAKRAAAKRAAAKRAAAKRAAAKKTPAKKTPARKAAAKRAAAKKAAAKKAAAKKAAAKKAAAKKAAAKKAAAKRAAAKRAAAKKAAAKKTRPKALVSSGPLVPGTASRDVYFLQEALIQRGYSIPAGPTGYFGVRTVGAVKAFQRDQGWRGKAADGVPGTGTLRALGLL